MHKASSSSGQNLQRNKTFKDLKKDTQKGFYKPTKRHVTNLDTHYM